MLIFFGKVLTARSNTAEGNALEAAVAAIQSTFVTVTYTRVCNRYHYVLSLCIRLSVCVVPLSVGLLACRSICP